MSFFVYENCKILHFYELAQNPRRPPRSSCIMFDVKIEKVPTQKKSLAFWGKFGAPEKTNREKVL